MYLKSTLILLSCIFFAACSSPAEKSEEYISSGFQLLESQQYSKAGLQFKNALQINQDNVQANYGLALVEIHTNGWGRALQLLEKVRLLDAENEDARIKLIQLYLASGQLDKALNELNSFEKNVSKSARFHAVKAAVLYRIGEVNQALNEIELAIDKGEKNQDALLVKAKILIDQNSFQKAIATLDEGLKSNQKNLSFYQLKIHALKNLGNQKEVITTYKEIIKTFPENKAFKKGYINYLIEIGNLEGAKKEYLGVGLDKNANTQDQIEYIEFLYKYDLHQTANNYLDELIKNNPDDSDLLFYQVELFKRNDDVDSAQNVLLSLLEQNISKSSLYKAKNQLALLMLNKKDLVNAEKLNNEVLEEDKFNEEALFIRSGLKLARNDIDGAIIDLRIILRDNPDSFRALSLMGKLHHALNNIDLAKEFYLKAYEVSPSRYENVNNLVNLLINESQFDRADVLLEKSFQRGNKNINSLKLLIKLKIELNDWVAVEKLANILQDFKGEETLALQIKGFILEKKEEYEESINTFKKAHLLAPGEIKPIVYLVRSLVRNKEHERAIDFLNSILKIKKNDYSVHVLLGQVYQNLEDYDKALFYYKKAISLEPSYSLGYRVLASIYVNKNQLKKAISSLIQGAEETDDAFIRILLATLYERQKNYELAITTYEELLSQHPNVLVAKNNLASLLTDHRTDHNSLMKAVSLSKDFKNSEIPHFRDTYAWASFKANDNLDEVISILRSIVIENENTPIFNYHLGMVYQSTGDDSKASRYLENVLKHAEKTSPIFISAKNTLATLQ